MAASRAVEFLKGKQLGRGAFIPQQLRWSPDTSADASAVWWPAISGQPGVVGRATDLIHAEGELRAYTGISFRRHCGCGIVGRGARISGSGTVVRSKGPTCVTLSGETLDAAGVITGGGNSGGGGLLQRRREVLELEARRTEAGQALEQTRAARDEASAELGFSRVRTNSALPGPFVRRRCWSCRCRRTMPGVERQRGELHRRMEVLGEELQRGLAEQARLQDELQSSQAQLEQWVSEKAGQEAGLRRSKGAGECDRKRKHGGAATIDRSPIVAGEYPRASGPWRQ